MSVFAPEASTDITLQNGHTNKPDAYRELAPRIFYPSQQQQQQEPTIQHGNGAADSLPKKPAVKAATRRKRIREDSDFSDLAEEDAGSDFDVGDDADSDDSFNRYRTIYQGQVPGTRSFANRGLLVF